VETEGSFSVACADQDGAEVAVLIMVPGGGSEVGCAWAGQFDAAAPLDDGNRFHTLPRGFALTLRFTGRKSSCSFSLFCYYCVPLIR
jgi:hypothetical protein